MKKAETSHWPTSFIDIPAVRILDVSVTDTSRSQWFQNIYTHPVPNLPRSTQISIWNIFLSCLFNRLFISSGHGPVSFGMPLSSCLLRSPRTSVSEEEKKSFHVDETLHQGRRYALRRGLQIVRNIFNVVFLPRTDHSRFRWGHNEGRKQKAQLYWMCIFPSISSFL